MERAETMKRSLSTLLVSCSIVFDFTATNKYEGIWLDGPQVHNSTPIAWA